MLPSQWQIHQQQQRGQPQHMPVRSPLHGGQSFFAPQHYRYDGSWHYPSIPFATHTPQYRSQQQQPQNSPTGATASKLLHFTKAVAETYRWNDQTKQSPLFEHLKKENKANKRGWAREMMKISNAKNDIEPLHYYDLLVDNSPQLARHVTIMEVFGHAFDMTSKNTNNAQAKRRKILKEIQPARPPLDVFNTPGSSKKKRPLSSGKRRVSFSDVKAMKTPDHLTRLQNHLDTALMKLAPEITESTRKKAAEHAKDTGKWTQLIANTKRFDTMLLLRILAGESDLVVHRKSFVDELRSKAKIYSAVENMLSKGFYTGNTECQQMLAAGVSMVPSISMEAAQYLIATVRHSLLLELGFRATGEEVARTSPSSKKIKGCLSRLAASCLAKKLQIVDAAKYIYLACDKGHKDGVDHFVKILSCWDKSTKKVDFFLLDMDGAGSSDEDAADAVAFSLQQKEVGKGLSGIATDSGGGGTLESFLEALQRRGVVADGHRFVSPCSLHCLQLMFALPVEKALGLGGLQTRNAMQLLHSMHDLEKYFPREVWRQMLADKIKELGLQLPVPNAMPKPVTTRWWWLHTAADIAVEYWLVWQGIAKDCIATFGTTSYANIVSSSLEAMMKEEVYFLDIVFIKCYAIFMINPHFDFLQSKGKHSQVAGFNSESVLVRTFLMGQDIKSLQDGGWRDIDVFKPVVDHLAGPRWPSKEAQETEDATREAMLVEFGPKIFMKKEAQSQKMMRALLREHKSRTEIDTIIQLHKDSRKENYWVDLKDNGGSALTAIHSLFGFPKRRKCTASNKTRLTNKQEKQDELATLGDVSQQQFDLEFTENRRHINDIDEKLSSIELGRKENLLRTFEIVLEEEEGGNSFDTKAYEGPLQTLFCEEGNNIDLIEITIDLVETKLAELKTEIAELKLELSQRLDHELMNGPSLSHEDEMVEQREVAIDETIDQEVLNTVNEDFQKVINRQTDIFLTLAYKQFNKHFLRWARRLLFFGLASEKETAEVVSNFLLGNDLTRFNNMVHESSVHCRKVNLGEFSLFLVETSSAEDIDAVRATDYFKTHKDGVKKLSEGHDLWAETSIAEVRLLRTFVEDAILPVPSNTQFVELCVKEGMYVGKANRTEASRSVLGIIRTFLVREANARAREHAQDRELKANQYGGKGKIGERKLRNKSQDKDMESRVCPRGRYKTIEILDIVDLLNSGEDSAEKRAKIDRLMKNISVEDLHYAQRKKMRLLERVRQGKTRKKKQNRLQKRQDLVLTDTTLGRIPYSSLARTHMEEVKKELEARDTDFNEGWGIKRLVAALKEGLKSSHGEEKFQSDYTRSFHPVTLELQRRFPFTILESEV